MTLGMHGSSFMSVGCHIHETVQGSLLELQGVRFPFSVLGRWIFECEFCEMFLNISPRKNAIMRGTPWP